MKTGIVVALLVSLAFGQRQRPSECSNFDGGINMCDYEDHSRMISRLTRLAERFPGLAQIGAIGKSVQGKALVYIKISTNVTDRSHLEPMFRYVGNMHGDETVGRQLIIYMAHYLLQGYGRDDRVTRLVDNTEIFLMPTMNPDGYAASKAGCGLSGFFNFGAASGRNNANNKDLNRDFPRQFDDPKFETRQDLERNRQPETIAMMRWILSQPFVLSANMHAGAVVASYPFDDSASHRTGSYSASPDDDFFKRVARIYARNHAVMRRGNACGENFPQGITNGAHWYDVPGGMQDFNYVYTNDFEITLELTCCKHPPANALVEEWTKNKESMLLYMEAIHSGIKGDVVDADTGRPIRNAAVIIHGNRKTVRTTRQGEFWRLLAPGQYNMTVQATGYEESNPLRITVNENGPEVRRIALRQRR